MTVAIPSLGHDVIGDASGPVVVMSSGLGTRRTLLDDTAHLLAADHRVVTIDLPGHGTSAAVREAYRLEDAAAAILMLLDGIEVESFTFLGVSVSGAIAQALALAAPDRIRSLVLCGTAAHWPDQADWRARADRVRAEGVAFMVPSRRGLWFSDGFAERYPDRVAAVLDDLAGTDPTSYAACCDAIRRFDGRGDLHRIATPTTVVVGDRDAATPPALAEGLHRGIPGSELIVVPGGYHLLPLEHPGLMADLVRRVDERRATVTDPG